MTRRRLAAVLVAALAMSSLSSVTPAGAVAGFGDVNRGQYFTEAVQWMVDNEITSGVTPECFGPDQPVSRWQAAVLMYRMEGSPPPGEIHPFDDVAPWLNDAVSWMFNQGITLGTTATTYSPHDILTRAELAAFLHRLAGSPDALAPTQFPDVTQRWQLAPVGWMVEQGITMGTTAVTFSPGAIVNRGQLATFFHRYKGSPPVVIDDASPGCVTFDSLRGLHTIGNYTSFVASGASRWYSAVPGIQAIEITSTMDGAQQPVFWLPPTGNGEQPLMVILHSWSADYTQHAGIPYARWARENGWAVIAPDFRGRNTTVQAVGSDLAVQDAADAIDHAIAQGGVDADRVYVVGYSGGGMMALLLAGRHPDKVSAVAAWGPPHDLIEFYDFSARLGRPYATHVATACGGNPTSVGPAQEECLWRSPVTHLDVAREHQVPVLIAQGISDPFVETDAAVEVFNLLADPEDRLAPAAVDLFRGGVVPDGLPEWGTTETYFGSGDPAPVFARASASALLVYFQAGHDMAYHATARWFATDPG